MSDPLITYLYDHLAGAEGAIELLRDLREEYAGKHLGRFAADLLREVEADRQTLNQLLARYDAGHSHLGKQALAWLGEKLSWVKFHRTAGKGLGTLQAFEVLALGILGKRALWDALALLAPNDPRLSDLDFHHLAARAQTQHDQVEAQRLELVSQILAEAA